MKIEDVIVLTVAAVFVFALRWARDKLRIGRFPFFFINRPSMRTRFYLQERKERERKRRQRNSN